MFTIFIILAIVTVAVSVTLIARNLHHRSNTRRRAKIFNDVYSSFVPTANAVRTLERMQTIINESNAVCVPIENGYDDPKMEWNKETHAVYMEALSRANVARRVKRILEDNSLTQAQRASDVVGVYEVMVSCDSTSAEIEVASEAAELIASLAR